LRTKAILLTAMMFETRHIASLPRPWAATMCFLQMTNTPVTWWSKTSPLGYKFILEIRRGEKYFLKTECHVFQQVPGNLYRF